MSNATAAYRAIDDVVGKFERLLNKFKAFFEVAQCLEGPQAYGGSIKLTNRLENMAFLVDFLDKQLEFRFASGLSEKNDAIGVVTCLQTIPGVASAPLVIKKFNYNRNGTVLGIEKPGDFEDPLTIDDSVSAVFIISHCIEQALKQAGR